MKEVAYGMQLHLDPLANLHVHAAMDARASIGDLPDNAGSNRNGELIAEICRGWMEYRGIEIPSLPPDSGERLAGATGR